MIATTNGHATGSLNDATARDPFNNNCYGTMVDRKYKLVSLPVLDVNDFNERIIRGYEEGYGEKELPADLSLARSLVPAGTASLRDFSNISPEIPEYIADKCTGCMDCVTECPDTAILGKVLSETEWNEKMSTIPEADREMYLKQWSKTKKYYDAGKKRLGDGGMFQIIIDPSKCKGCAECVTVCDDDALKMIAKTDEVMLNSRKSHRYFKNIGPSNEKYISDSLLIDMMLKEQTMIYTGGAGSCAGCGEGTALRMLCAATALKHNDDWGIIAATGCNTVYTSTYPYNPYLVPWSNSLFENAPTYAIGVRMRWDQMGWDKKPLWCIGGDGAMFDIGFHRPEHEDERARQVRRRQTGATQGNRSNRDDAPANLCRANDVCPYQPLLQVGVGRNGIRRTRDRRMLHDLSAGTRRGRQHGRRAGPARSRYPCLPALDL
jgi:ferredoxin